MAREDSVVTPERYAQGFNYPDYIDQIKVNKQRFEGFYDGLTISAEDTAFFKELTQRPTGPAKMMVIGEDWCGDVIRGLPVLARVAEAAGIPISIFPRDSHMDIMNEYLNKGEFLSIPVAVFYTNDHKYICHWIERPALANNDRARIEAEVKAQNPLIDDASLRTQVRNKNNALFPAWQQASVEEIRAMLSKEIGI